MSLSKESLVGSLVEGRYLIEEELGVGGIGAVYLARDLKVLGRNVVVKVLLEESFQNEYVVKKFRQEAEALSRLDHPNIVNIYDYGEMQGGQPYLVLQFIDGVSLRKVVEPGGIELERAANIIRQAAGALTAAHEKGILHRDLKPDNIMLQTLGGEERAIVIDFGIAQVQDSVISPKTMITSTVGSVNYMSPEQLSGSDLTPASDTYALGVIAYEIVTGQKPYAPKSPFQLVELQRAGVQTPPSALRPDLPAAAQDAIMRALSFDAAQRQQRTRDFGSEFYRAVTGAPSFSASQSGATGVMTSVAAGDAGAAGADPSRVHTAVNTNVSQAPAQPSPIPQPAEVEAPYTPATVEATTPKRGSKGIVFAVVALLVLAAAGVAGFFVWKSRQATAAHVSQPVTGAPPSNSATPGASAATTVAPELTLNYSLTVQKMRDGKEYQQPFESTGREIFESGWRFRLNLSTPRDGYLYLVNEGLNDKGAQTYTVLYPLHGDAHIAAGQNVQIPEKNYYEFTGEPGTEKIWVVWSERPVPEMEAIKGLANPKDQGEVSDPTQIEALRNFFAAHNSPQPEVTEDKVNKRTTVKAAGDMLVHLAELEHH
jgi:serine/threonine-protein kinase